MICTFFGHHDATSSIIPHLHEVLEKLLQEKNDTLFLVGNQGAFDHMIIRELKELQKVYPNMTYQIVLAYHPGLRPPLPVEEMEKTIYPDGLEKTPPRFAVDKRNRIMLNQADTVVTYVYRSGGAQKFKEMALKKGKTVIELAEI